MTLFPIRPILPAFALTRGFTSNKAIASMRLLGSKSEAPKFDAIMVEAYKVVAENHRHEKGPWTLMTNHCVSATAGIRSPRILDIATGPGEPAKTIAMTLPHATVIASDVSADMVKAAMKNMSDLSNVECIEADAQDLSQLESNSIDVVTCCYGYMFPTDKAAALGETFRVMKPGGTLIATTWDKIDMMKISADVMKEVLGFDPPPPPLNPLSLGEEGLFRSLLHDAGFVDIEQTSSTYPFNWTADREMQFTIGTMLLRDKINEIAETDDEAWKKAEAAFWKDIEKYSVMHGDHMVLPNNTFRLTVAKKAST